MAVAFDVASNNTLVTSTTGVSFPSMTLSHNPVSITNGALIVFSTYLAGVSNTICPDCIPYIITMTYAGNSMTYYGTFTAATGRATEVWYYIGTVAGAQSIVITWDDSANPGGLLELTARSTGISVTGANQSTPIVQSGTASGTTSPVTKALTTASANNMLLACAFVNKGTSASVLTVSGGATQRSNASVGTNGSTTTTGVSTLAATGGSDTMSWTQSVNRNWGEYMLEIGEFVASTTRLLSALGCGT